MSLYIDGRQCGYSKEEGETSCTSPKFSRRGSARCTSLRLAPCTQSNLPPRPPACSRRALCFRLLRRLVSLFACASRVKTNALSNTALPISLGLHICIPSCAKEAIKKRNGATKADERAFCDGGLLACVVFALLVHCTHTCTQASNRSGCAWTC